MTTAKQQMISASKPIATQMVEWALEEFSDVTLMQEVDGKVIKTVNVTLMQELAEQDSSYDRDFPKTSHLSKILMEMGYTNKIRKKVKGRLCTIYTE